MNPNEAQSFAEALRFLLGAREDATSASATAVECGTRFVRHAGRSLIVAMKFEGSPVPELAGTVTVAVTEEDLCWYNERGLPPRRPPRTSELKLVVTSNMDVRGPMQAWEAELLTPLVREFVLGIVEQRAKLSVVPDKMPSEAMAQRAAGQGKEAGHGEEED